jgi:hypothetical protein
MKDNNNNNINYIQKTKKPSRIFSPLNTNNQNHTKNSKFDLKHLLIFNDTLINENHNNNNSNSNNNNILNINLKKSTLNFNQSEKFETINCKSNLESSGLNIFSFSESNKNIISDIMKQLKYQFSSLDHQKMALDILNKNKGKNFCIFISEESLKKNINVIT